MSENGFDFGERFASASDRVRQVPEQRRRLASKSVKFGIAYLDDVAHGLLPNDFVVMSAVTGGGKTTMGSLFAQLSAEAGRRVHYFALEAHRNEIEQRMLFRRMAKLVAMAHPHEAQAFSYGAWVHGKVDALADRVEEAAVIALRTELQTLQTYYRDKRFTTQDIARLFHSIRNETDLIVFDHLHDVDSEDQNENRAMRDIVRTVADLVQLNETPVIAIAHLRKPDLRSARLVPDLSEFHGSSEITKYATKAFIIAPARDQPAHVPGVANTYMRVAKDRIVGTSSFTALIGFNMSRNEYEGSYVLGRLSFAGDDWQPVPPGEVPQWAERATAP